MEIRYQVLESDYVSAAKLFISSRPKTFVRRVILPILWAIILLSVIFIYWVTRTLNSVLPMLALPAIYIICRLLFPLQLKRNYRKSTTLHGPIDFQVNETGTSVATSQSQGKSDWSTYMRFAENDRTFVLVQQGDLLYIPIPKRELTPSQIDELRNIFQTHIKITK